MQHRLCCIRMIFTLLMLPQVIKSDTMQFCWIITSKMNMRFLFTSFVSTMNIFAQGSTDRQVLGLTGPNRSEIFKILLVPVRSEIWKFFRTEPLGPRPIGFGPWIPVFAVIIFDQRLNLWGGTIDWISVCDESIVRIDPFWVKEFQFIAIFGFSERILWMVNPRAGKRVLEISISGWYQLFSKSSQSNASLWIVSISFSEFTE